MKRETTHDFRYEKRNWLIALILVLIIFGVLQNPALAQDVGPIKLSWLGENPPALSSGVSWGVPLPEGKIDPSSSYSLKNALGEAMPVQSWPLAYWPDGSLKWIGLSTVVDSDAGTTFELQPVKTTGADLLLTKIELTETDDDVLVNTGVLQCNIPKHGKQLISFMKMDGKEISSGGRLVCILQNGPSKELGAQPSKEMFIGSIEKVTIEQNVQSTEVGIIGINR